MLYFSFKQIYLRCHMVGKTYEYLAFRKTLGAADCPAMMNLTPQHSLTTALTQK